MTYSHSQSNEPIHSYFGLSYSNYQVMPRTLLQSMPVDWQRDFVKLLEQYDKAFAHVKQADCYQVLPAEDVYLEEASEAHLIRGRYTKKEPECTCEYELPSGELQECENCANGAEALYFDEHDNECQGHEHAIIPLVGDDPVPHYNRGRTRVEPRLGGAK